ncbi:MAG TPA: PDZ domain-containing protein, partial [bacterium]|nr:PDZ domain-containing protein [bacterium]
EAIWRHLAELRAGFVRHPWLGLSGITITPQVALELGLAPGGVLITEVIEGGPAALAGLRGGRAASARDLPRGGDVIVAIDGRPVATFGTLAAYVLSRRIGDTVTLELLRDGQTVLTTVVLGERPGI